VIGSNVCLRRVRCYGRLNTALQTVGIYSFGAFLGYPLQWVRLSYIRITDPHGIWRWAERADYGSRRSFQFYDQEFKQAGSSSQDAVTTQESRVKTPENYGYIRILVSDYICINLTFDQRARDPGPISPAHDWIDDVGQPRRT
jgi:hypothetical protein